MTDPVDALMARLPYVEAIERGRSSKAGVADELGVSESAVYKAVRELRDTGVVEEDGYELTVTGRLLFDGYRRMEKVADASELFDELDVPTEVLEGARPVMPKRHSPQKPIEKIERAAAGAERLRGLAPTLIERYVTSTAELIEEDGLDAEFVVDSTVFDELSNSYPDEFWGSVENGMEVMVTDEEMPFALAIYDADRVGVVVYDDRGRVQGALFFRSPEAVDWAENLYREFRREAEHVDGVEV